MWRGVALLAGLLLSIGGGLPLAEAQTTCVQDPGGDVTNETATAVAYPPADVLELCFDATPEALVFRMAVAQPLDPVSDPAWANAFITLDLYVQETAAGDPTSTPCGLRTTAVAARSRWS